MLQDIVGLALLLCAVCVSKGNAFVLPYSVLLPTRNFVGSCQYHSGALTISIAHSRVQTSRSKISAQVALDESSTAHDVIERFVANLKGKTALVTG